MKRIACPAPGSEVTSVYERFERRALANGIEVVRVEGAEGAADAIASRTRGGRIVAVEVEIARLGSLLEQRGLRVERLEELDPEGLLVGCDLAVVRVAAAALPDAGSVVLAGSSRVQLVTSLSEHLFVLLEPRLLEEGWGIGEVVRRAAERGLGPVYIVSGPSSTRDIEHVPVRGATGPRSVTCLIGDLRA